MGGSSRAAGPDSGRLYEVSRPDGADERAARRFASGAAGLGHLHASGPADRRRVPPVVDEVLASSGTPLDAATRGPMEPRLGHDLANVRIHAGPDADLAARSVQALAFTAGSHVVLGASAPAAASPAGAQLMAHELSHVAQQASGGGLRLQRLTGDEAPKGTGAGALDDATWWQQFVTQLRGTLGEGFEHALGQVEGVALELTGMTADPLLWATSPEAMRATVDSFLDILPVALPQGLRSAIEDAVAVGAMSASASIPPELGLLRSAMTAAGFTDPYTGAPALSPAVSALADLVDKDVIQPLFGTQDQDATLNARDVGQLEGAIATQLVLAFTGVGELEDALKAIGATSMIKGITDLMARDHAEGKPWLSDPAFWTQIAGAVLYCFGLKFARAGQKLTGALTEWIGAVVSTIPAAIQLEHDWAAPESDSKKKIIMSDVLALIKQLVLLLLPLVGMARKVPEASESSETSKTSKTTESDGTSKSDETSQASDETSQATGPARRVLTEADLADAEILGARTVTELTRLKTRLRTGDRPSAEYFTAEGALSDIEAAAQDPAVREAAGRLLGTKQNTGLLRLAASVLNKPENYRQVIADLERNRLELGLPKTIDGYTTALVDLAQRTGRAVYELGINKDRTAITLKQYGSPGQGVELTGGGSDPKTGLVDPEEFMDHVSGRLFVDNAFMSEDGKHGNLTHLIQNLVLDNYFRRNGENINAFFYDLNLVSRSLPGDVSPALLWDGVFDPMYSAHLTQPESIWPVLGPLLDPTLFPERQNP